MSMKRRQLTLLFDKEKGLQLSSHKLLPDSSFRAEDETKLHSLKAQIQSHAGINSDLGLWMCLLF